ncbi:MULTISPECIES: hypothetical protein [unclassified Pseudomonas]|uniref:hypothetical protein n=1 Tax=unclassified Pseudomonas TaxID=196821 RepID=UPI0021C79A75|nr:MULTISPECIES: hypothetical protein [unclassified Pseudomonas]MCU1722778.1 hypothetical protein [Pseudomonas sp. 5P_5.1_Bac1]MCU1733009.1 hypothetical protein [Pseudomonas sp. 20P_3.2_Bac4]MCU1744110.1 hypothetical protein [Pseudomonas sp. 20P_3.2_Bac5]
MAGVDDIVLQVSQLTEVEELETVKAAVTSREVALQGEEVKSGGRSLKGLKDLKDLKEMLDRDIDSGEHRTE